MKPWNSGDKMKPWKSRGKLKPWNSGDKMKPWNWFKQLNSPLDPCNPLVGYKDPNL